MCRTQNTTLCTTFKQHAIFGAAESDIETVPVLFPSGCHVSHMHDDL